MKGGLGPKALSRGVSTEIACVVPFVKDVFEAHKIPCILTSITDRTHGKGSLHYTGDAIDILWSESWGANPIAVDNQLYLALNGFSRGAHIPPDYDVVFENDHFHIEFQPKIPAHDYQEAIKRAGI